MKFVTMVTLIMETDARVLASKNLDMVAQENLQFALM